MSTSPKRHFPPPPPLTQKPQGLWTRTPPAIFPSIMGFLGLGLAWRTFAWHPARAPLAPIGEVILGAGLLLFTFALIAWISKPLRRPGILLEEPRILPGRAGMAAMSLSVFLSAAALLPLAPAMAETLVFAALGIHLGLAALLTWSVMTGPVEQRTVTPVFHLTYVGFILAPLSLVPLGYGGLSEVIYWFAIGVAVLIWGASLRQLIATVPPAPLRPLLAIHLAPASLFATVSMLLGKAQMGFAFGLLALAILVVLVASARWILASGFSPFWGALTFPLAACATALTLSLSPWIGAPVLALATGLNPWVLQKVLKLWAKGDLAIKTNAASV